MDDPNRHLILKTTKNICGVVRTLGRSDAHPPLFSIFAFVATGARPGPLAVEPGGAGPRRDECKMANNERKTSKNGSGPRRDERKNCEKRTKNERKRNENEKTNCLSFK